MLGDLPEVKEVGKWQNWTLNTIYLDSVWIPILCTTSTIPLVLCCQCGGDSTLIWKVPVKRSPCHLHHSSADALSPVMWLGPTQAVQWDSPLKWWSVFMQVVSSAIVIQKFIIFERRLGKSCLQWNVMLIRPRWLWLQPCFSLDNLVWRSQTWSRPVCAAKGGPGGENVLLSDTRAVTTTCHVWTLQTSRHSLIIIIKIL